MKSYRLWELSHSLILPFQFSSPLLPLLIKSDYGARQQWQTGKYHQEKTNKNILIYSTQWQLTQDGVPRIRVEWLDKNQESGALGRIAGGNFLAHLPSNTVELRNVEWVGRTLISGAVRKSKSETLKAQISKRRRRRRQRNFHWSASWHPWFLMY